MTTILSASTPTAGETIAPVVEQRRIDSLDVLRGLAVLGILVMNIQSFGLPMAAYSNPTAYGDFTGANYWVWLVGELLADLKFMSIFSMLFGAGVILFTSRVESRGGHCAALHYRRMGWLLGIGMLHAYLLWYGDILVMYAICGMVLYWARRLKPRTLMGAGIAALFVTAGLTLLGGMQFARVQRALDEHDRVAPSMSATAVAPGDEELLPDMTVTEGRAMIKEMRDSFAPPPEQIERETNAMTGAYGDELVFRAPTVVFMQTFILLFFGGRVLGMMLIGMALFKWGVLSAARPTRFYVAMVAIGFGVGLPLIWLGIRQDVAADFSFINAKFFNSHYNYFASIFVSLGWVGLIMLLCRFGWFVWLKAALGAVGRMAFTNYLMHTIVCTTIFNGRSGLGFAKFGQLDRVELLGVVAAVLAFQLIASPIWLGYFRFGPFEWLWRSLTYWNVQPMRKERAARPR